MSRKFLVPQLCLTLLVCMAASAQSAPKLTAAQIVDKNIAARGGLQAWRSLQTMTWKGKHPIVELVTNAYQTGVKLTKEAMQVVETHLQRWSSLEKWCVDIPSSLPIEPQSHPSLQEKSTSQKRSRGRPRTRPLPDPTQPKRPRGRPRKPVLAESITPIATLG